MIQQSKQVDWAQLNCMKVILKKIFFSLNKAALSDAFTDSFLDVKP